MPAPDIAIPSRAPAEVSADDTILPFEVAALDLRGRVVRLGPAVDTILTGHDYPQPVAKLLGEAIVLGVMLGTALKFEGRFILQTKTDGPVPMLVVDFTTPDKVRACARLDKERVAAAIAAGKHRCGRAARARASRDDHRSGRRHEPLSGAGRARGRHAGGCGARIFPALRADPDARAARGRRGVPRRVAAGASHRWRAGGMLLQFVPRAPERARVPDLDPGDAPEGTAPHTVPEDDAWVEGRSLIETVEDIELIDPALSSERLLYRLFHERGVRVFRSAELRAQCSCSRDSVEAMLRSFPQTDRDDMVENGVISVTCEFCSATYVFEPADVADRIANERRRHIRIVSPIQSRSPGLSSEKVGIAMSNGSPSADDHAVAAGHEAGRRRQRHAAGVFERLARLEHRLLADHAGTAHLLAASHARR